MALLRLLGQIGTLLTQNRFQWASLQVHQITRCRTESSVWKRLDNLPEDLQKAYDEIWNEIEDYEEPDKTLVKRAFRWVMAATYPMRSASLLPAIRVGSTEDVPFITDKIDEQGLLSLCGNFLVIDSKSQWRFSHLSVVEYLETRHQWSIRQAHCDAAIACLSFFITAYEKEDPSTVITNDSDWYYEDSPDFDIFDAKNVFHEYMRHDWVFHVHGAQATEDSPLSFTLKTFLGTPEESSVQYRRWHKQIDADSEYSIFADPQGFDVTGFDQSWFDNRESIHAYGSEDRFRSELAPVESPVFAMCRFAFDSVLSSWWDSPSIDVSRKSEVGHNLLTIAAMGGSVPICQKLIEKGTDVNLRLPNANYGSALVAAAHKGRTGVLKCLVQAGADVNMALQSQEGYMDIDSLLEELKGYDYEGLDSRASEGWFDSALTAAVEENHVEATRYLVNEANANIHKRLHYEDLGCVLERAVDNANHEIIECLVKAGADVNKPPLNPDNGSILLISPHRLKLKTFRFLIEEAETDVNIPFGESGTILESVARDGEMPILKYLVEQVHIDVNIKSLHGTYGSPLAAAVLSRDVERVKYLLDKGAIANMEINGKYGSAIAAAAFENDMEILKILLEAGADLTAPITGGDYGSCLAAAASANAIEALKFLIGNGADVNMTLPGGKYGSALAAAATARNSDELDGIGFHYLLEQGADVNAPLTSGDYGSVLAAAIAEFLTENVKTLLAAGANVNLPLRCGKYGSALAAAAAHGEETTRLLIEKGADVNMQLTIGNYGNALTAAAARGEETTRLLIERGADVNMPLTTGLYGSALAAAASNLEGIDSVKLLLESGADLNAPLSVGIYGSAVTAAAIRGLDNDKLNFLIEAGADVNPSPGGKFGTPLMAAAFFGQKETVEILIKAGANVNLRVENFPFATALQATETPILAEDFLQIRKLLDPRKADRVCNDILPEWKAGVAEILKRHGATA